MAIRHISGLEGTRSTANWRFDLGSRQRDVSPAGRWFRCAVALIALVAVVAIFIAPQIDLPNGVLRDHSVGLHGDGNHSLGGVVAFVLTDSFHARHPAGEVRTAGNRPRSNRGCDDQRMCILRC